ncbi:MAG: hydrogenase 2 operon protein HybA [Alphaproteobacteria bacterium]|nr:hydrogenase 2 operon protein HybA [Rhodospirillales bacterium]MCW9045017.1 hydrogenase 2 operon protein HybA [Alphaproteobacteria bacterium]
MKRREFLKGALGTSAATVCGVMASSKTAEARPNLEVNDNAVGMLYDSTLCVGCKACVAKCKEVNDMSPVIESKLEAWDEARDLSGDTLNVIKVYKNGTAKTKDAETDGFAFEKRSCMHCVDPGCVSACPVTALEIQQKTGIITYNPDACIGCRTCMTACPYNVPQFEYDKTFGQIHKCQMCNQKGVERIDKGQMTGCAEACPTGATLFGTRKQLLEEAKRRTALKPGDIYNYPMGDLSKPDSYHEKPVPNYKDHIWGEKEAGGTNVMHISSISFDKLGMPPLEERSYASMSEGVQHTLYSYLALPAVALAGLSFVVKRNIDSDGEGGDS